MSKISAYHYEKSSHKNNPFEICSDYFIKTNLPENVSDSCKRQIIYSWLHEDETTKIINQKELKDKLLDSLIKINQ